MSAIASSDRVTTWLNAVLLFFAGCVVMIPTLWMVLSSFKQSFEVTAYPPTVFFTPTLEN